MVRTEMGMIVSVKTTDYRLIDRARGGEDTRRGSRREGVQEAEPKKRVEKVESPARGERAELHVKYSVRSTEYAVRNTQFGVGGNRTP